MTNSLPATCTHCQASVRQDGLQLVSNEDELTACPDAPMETCSYCAGEGCGSCEGCGEVYGRHEVATADDADATALPVVVASTLSVGDWFTLDGTDYRAVWHWSTGVEIVNHYAEKRVISSATLVQL